MTARRVRLLAGVAFGRLFETDLFSSSVSASSGLTWLLAALATPGVMFSGSQMFYYAHVRTFAPALQDRLLLASQTFHVHFAMAMAGLVTMLVWTSLAPDRRDALVLGPLPVRPHEQAFGRLLALAAFCVMFAAAVAVPTAVVFTSLTAGPAEVAQVPARVAGHIAGTMAGAAFVFGGLVAIQALLAAALGPRAVRMATWPLQAAALVAMVAALSRTAGTVDALVAPGAAGNAWLTWSPAAWFVGLYRWVSGDARPVMAVLAGRAAAAGGALALVTLVAYPLAYRRCLEQAISGDGARPGRWTHRVSRLWLRALGPLLRSPLERGVAAFIGATLTRSHAHRFLIGSYLGVAGLCALPLVARLAGDAAAVPVRFAWFSVPLGLLCWSAAAMRVAMMLPVEPDANWVFRLTEPVDKRRVLSAAATVIQGATALPLALAFGAAAAIAGGMALGATVFGVVTLTGLALVEALTLTLRAVPCTCTYRPGQLRLRALWPVYLFVWIAIAYRLPAVAVASVGDGRRTAALLGALLTVWAGLRAWRLARAHRLRDLVYDEVDPSATTTVDLSSVRA